MPLEKIAPLSEKEYFVRGSTALLDAVGSAIHHIGNVHKYARKEDVPQKTLFIITTDGMENSSHQYTYEKVQHMIERQKERYGWEFLFLGANMDAAKEAARMGIHADHAATYNCDSMGTAVNFEAMSDAITMLREERCLNVSWKDGIEKDRKKRGH